MRWRDIRFEKPTKADGDDRFDEIAFITSDGVKCSSSWENFDCGIYVAWMPLSELPAFDRIPDPPEGWRFVDKEKDKKRLPYKYVSKRSNEWQDGDSPGIPWERDMTYIVPIDPPAPPEPQYRPFANAAEFEPYKNCWWRYKDDLRSVRRPPMGYSDDGHYGDKWDVSLIRKEFEDGSPFGVKVE
jgi:hypothetical protein